MTRFCQECGHLLEADQRFCPECGTAAGHHESKDAGTANTEQQTVGQKEPVKTESRPLEAPSQQPVKARQSMTMIRKVVLSVAALLLIALVAGHYTIQAKTSPEKTLTRFMAAVESGNAELLMETITVPEGVAGDGTGLMALLQQVDPDVLREEVTNAKNVLAQGAPTMGVTDGNGNHLFALRSEKVLGMYPAISIEMQPVQVEVVTDFQQGELAVEGKTVDLSKGNQDAGRFLPGIYTMELSSGMADSVYNLPIEQVLYGTEPIVLSFTNKDYMVMLSSDIPEAAVHINGEPAGLTFADAKWFGPINLGESVEVQGVWEDEEGHTFRTNMETVRAGEIVSLQFPNGAHKTDSDQKDDGDAASSESGTDSDAAVTEETAESVDGTEEEPEEGSEANEPAAEEEEEAESEEAPAAEAPAAEEEVPFTEARLDEFYEDFRILYEQALNEKDFSRVEAFLSPEGTARGELQEFIGDIGNDYYLYEFWTNMIQTYDIQGNKAFITTYEEFDFTNHYNEVTNYERTKRYEIIHGESDMYQILSIENLETVRE